MCGIAGVIDFARPPDAALVPAMLAQLRHRGPETSAIAATGGASIGHCLLSFVDPPSHQPAASPCGRVLLAFNGQIYNYRDLPGPRASARGSAEAEILLDLYLSRGVDFVRLLRGMFAIAIADARDQRLILARDPFGKKPLYYVARSSATDGRRVAFASELKAFAVLPASIGGSLGGLDLDAVESFLTFGAIPAPMTIYKHARKVRPGSWLEFAPDRPAREVVYWERPSDQVVDETMTERGALDALETRLTSAITRRVEGTRQPLGIALSGGIDSGVLAALLARAFPSRRWPAFTVSFAGSALDERRAAASVARRLRLDHHVIDASGSRLADLVMDQYPKIDEPLADVSLIPMLALCQDARLSVKGLLGGDGADEIFLGYLSFHASEMIRRVKQTVPEGALKTLTWIAERLPPAQAAVHPSVILRMCARALDARPEMRFYEARSAFPTGRIPWHPDLARETTPFDVTGELTSFVGQPALELTRVQRGIVCHFLRDVILTKIDRASMLHSLEVRSPYLDIDLVDWVATVPTRLKLRRLHGKHLLRKLHARLLPLDSHNRVKRGFRPPLPQLLRRELRRALLDVLSARNVARVGVFDPRIVVRQIDEHLRGVRDHQQSLWPLFCFHLWHRQYMGHVGTGPARPLASALEPAVRVAAAR